MADDFANIFELSRRLKIPTAWLVDQADAHRIPYLKIGARRFFSVAAVRRALARQAAAAGNAEPATPARHSQAEDDDDERKRNAQG